MNTEKNQEKWIEKCEEILKIGGKSDKTIVNYKSAWNRFLKYYPENTNISKLKEEDLLIYFKEKYFKKILLVLLIMLIYVQLDFFSPFVLTKNLIGLLFHLLNSKNVSLLLFLKMNLLEYLI